MNGTNEATVFAVQSAFLELLELTLAVVPADAPERQEVLRQEAQKTILMFIAAIILSNRDYNPSQKSFISVLVDCQDMPGGEGREQDGFLHILVLRSIVHSSIKQSPVALITCFGGAKPATGILAKTLPFLPDRRTQSSWPELIRARRPACAHPILPVEQQF